jgi:nucleotide-binding universal stress UspA family protein
MKLFDKVLLATDFSQCAEQLWHCVEELYQLGTQEVIAVHVTQMASGGRFADYAQKRLEQQLEPLRAVGFRTKAVVRTGPAAQEICEVAGEENVNLVLVGAKGENRIREFFLGSTVRDLIRICERPILIEKFQIPDGEQECAVVCTRKFSRVLLPLDFSENSLRLYTLLQKRLAGVVDEAILAHIVDQGSSNEVMEKIHRDALDRLTAMRENLADAGIKTEIRVRAGIASRHIVQMAEEDAATLVLMATRGAGNIKELLVGSTAENVARHSNRPVLLFPVQA